MAELCDSGMDFFFSSFSVNNGNLQHLTDLLLLVCPTVKEA